MQAYGDLSGDDRFRELLAWVRRDGRLEGDVLRVVPRPLEYWAFTTNANDVAERERVLEKHGGRWLPALKELATRYPYGVNHSGDELMTLDFEFHRDFKRISRHFLLLTLMLCIFTFPMISHAQTLSDFFATACETVTDFVGDDFKWLCTAGTTSRQRRGVGDESPRRHGRLCSGPVRHLV